MTISKLISQRLIPLTVPWQISVADASLRLILQEQGGTSIEFLVLCGYQAFEQDLQAGLIAYDAAAYLGSAAKQASFHIVSVSFGKLAGLRCQPLAVEAFNKAAYDCTAIPSLNPENKSHAVLAYDFKKYWNDNKCCLDPGAYIVENSTWLDTSGLGLQPYTHYLFLGQQLCIEVLAAEMQWLLKRPVFYRG